MKLFKNKKKANPKDAIAQLKETLDILEKRQAILEKKIENEEKIARANATKNKRCNINLFIYLFIYNVILLEKNRN